MTSSTAITDVVYTTPAHKISILQKKIPKSYKDASTQFTSFFGAKKENHDQET